MPPLFTSFEEAWAWFTGGGDIGSMGRWRERFARGRGQLLSLQAPLEQRAAADAILDVQDELADVADLVMFTPEMLHVSVRGVGFQVIEKAHPGDVLRQDVERVAQRAAKIIERAAPIEATVGPINVFPDALVMEVHEGGRLGELRAALAEATADAFGIGDAQYLPHSTIAMFRSPEAAPALRARLPALRGRPPARISIRSLEMARWWFTGIEAEDLPERDVVRTYRLRG